MRRLSIKELTKEIEKYTAENGSGKERLKYMRNKVVELGGYKKKYFIPYKHRKILNERKKEEIKKNRIF